MIISKQMQKSLFNNHEAGSFAKCDPEPCLSQAHTARLDIKILPVDGDAAPSTLLKCRLPVE